MIYIACALHCEAKPLVEKYKLKLDREASYPIFVGDEINLVVAGLGKWEMASAVSYLYAHCNEKNNAAWLNIGIAGHSGYPRGSLLNINKIIDMSSKKAWYPARIENIPGQNCALISVDTPETNYPSNMAIDMEASAFMSIVQRYTLVDLLQVIKIVSDNNVEDIEAIDKSLVSALMRDNLGHLDNAIQLLLHRQKSYADIYKTSEQIHDFLPKWHFTQYQRNELQKLLDTANTLEIPFSIQSCDKLKTAKEVLQYMRQSINAVELNF